MFQSSFPGKSRGVAILLHKAIPFAHSKVLSDSSGRSVIVTGQIYNVNIVVANVYAPKWDDKSFFKHFFSNTFRFILPLPNSLRRL